MKKKILVSIINKISRGTVLIDLLGENKNFDCGTGFLLSVPCKNGKLNCLLTNNHILNKTLLEKKIDFKITLDDFTTKPIEKIISLKKLRVVFTVPAKNVDLTIIQILKDDNIEDDRFLACEENLNERNLKEYIGTAIAVIQHPEGEETTYAEGEIIGLDLSQLVHTAETAPGSSGAPMISLKSKKVIGLHAGSFAGTEEHYGTSIKVIIEKFNGIQQELIKKDGKLSKDQFFGNLKDGKKNGRGVSILII